MIHVDLRFFLVGRPSTYDIKWTEKKMKHLFWFNLSYTLLNNHNKRSSFFFFFLISQNRVLLI